MCGTSTYSRIKGAAKKAKGAVKETVGKFIGSEKVQTEGKLDKAKSATHAVAGRRERCGASRCKKPK
jgi:uncharacterized protein YjbJ (UPF0337 family)